MILRALRAGSSTWAHARNAGPHGPDLQNQDLGGRGGTQDRSSARRASSWRKVPPLLYPHVQGRLANQHRNERKGGFILSASLGVKWSSLDFSPE